MKDLDLSEIKDEKAQAVIGHLVNFIEELSTRLREAQAEIQQLRDEINRSGLSSLLEFTPTF